jgi:hypothetical protein
MNSTCFSPCSLTMQSHSFSRKFVMRMIVRGIMRKGFFLIPLTNIPLTPPFSISTHRFRFGCGSAALCSFQVKNGLITCQKIRLNQTKSDPIRLNQTVLKHFFISCSWRGKPVRLPLRRRWVKPIGWVPRSVTLPRIIHKYLTMRYLHIKSRQTQSQSFKASQTDPVRDLRPPGVRS